MVFVHGHPVGPHEQRPFRRLFYTPYWTTFELPEIDTKAALVGIFDQIAAGDSGDGVSGRAGAVQFSGGKSRCVRPGVGDWSPAPECWPRLAEVC
jgi:hypothetical protein